MNGHTSTENLSRLISLPGAIPSPLVSAAERGRWVTEQLESGNILLFPVNPLPLSPDDRDFLLGLRQSSGQLGMFHKNVAYRPLEDRLTGLDASEPPDRKRRLGSILLRFSGQAARFIDATFPAYAGHVRRDFASFRPLEERGRPSRLRARNDLLHTDAFPTRPTHGDRILRVFTNLNPSAPRVWHTAETFAGLAPRFARDAGLPRGKNPRHKNRAVATFPHSPLPTPHSLLLRLGRRLGIPAAQRSPYDRFMLRFHNFLKENRTFQETCAKQRWEFPPDSAWIVFTDMVSHAVLSGQFALEQTFIVPRSAMLLPDKAPIAILETICGQPMGE